MATSTDHGARPRRRRWWLYVAAAVAVVLATVIGYGIARLTHTADNVGRGQLLPSAAAPTTPGATPITRPTRPAAAGQSLNVLVVRSAGDKGAAAEAIALVHVDDPRSRVDVFTVDPAAVSPVGGSTLAATHAAGGTAALVAAVEQLTQVPIDHAAEMTSPGFAALQTLMSDDALSSPLQAQDTLDTVMKNTTVDENFDMASMQRLAIELASKGRPTVRPVTAADLADPTKKQRLQRALQTDDLAAL